MNVAKLVRPPAISIASSSIDFNISYLPQGTGGLIGILGYRQFPILSDQWAFGYLSGGRWPFSLITILIAIPLYLWGSAASKKEAGIVKFLMTNTFLRLYKAIKFLLTLFFSRLISLQNFKTKDKNTFLRKEPIIQRKNRRVAQSKPIVSKKPRQSNLDLEYNDEYMLPPLDLLNPPIENSSEISQNILDSNSRMLESVLDDFGVRGEIGTAVTGPVVTRYDLIPSPGTKTSRVVSLADDIARSMSAVSVRVAVVPGKNVIGVELPNLNRETVLLREVLESDDWLDTKSNLPVALGKDIAGTPIVKDLAAMPHLLVAGTTGSGKSVAVNGMILSILYKHTPETCRLILVDPKMLELSVYDGIPHLLTPVVTEPSKAVMALKWAVREMEDRYKSMSKLGVRNIAGYNKRLSIAKSTGEVLSHRIQIGFDPETGKPIYEEQNINLTPLPLIVVVIDEVADLMLVAGKDIEAAVSAPQEGVPSFGPDGRIYPGTCRKRSMDSIKDGEALRLNIKAAIARVKNPLTYTEIKNGTITKKYFQLKSLITTVGDIVLQRRQSRDIAYHLSVVLDDSTQSITDVVRGEDLEDSTQIHVLLQKLLGLKTPNYHHHQLDIQYYLKIHSLHNLRV